MSDPESHASAASPRARCEKHQVSYNTGTSTGCPVCVARKASPVEPPSSKLPTFRLTAVVVLAVAAYFAVTRSAVLATETSGTIDGVTQPIGRLNPNAYQAEVQAMERAVAEVSESLTHGSVVANAANALADAIEARLNIDPSQRSALDQHLTSLSFFRSAITGTDDIGFSGYDRDFVLNEWERIRDEMFTGADWFNSFPRREAVADK